MGFFSRSSDELIQDSTDTGRAAYVADRQGQAATGAAYKAQSDATFQQWLDQTEAEHNARKGRR